MLEIDRDRMLAVQLNDGSSIVEVYEHVENRLLNHQQTMMNALKIKKNKNKLNKLFGFFSFT